MYERRRCAHWPGWVGERIVQQALSEIKTTSSGTRGLRRFGEAGVASFAMQQL